MVGHVSVIPRPMTRTTSSQLAYAKRQNRHPWFLRVTGKLVASVTHTMQVCLSRAPKADLTASSPVVLSHVSPSVLRESLLAAVDDVEHHVNARPPHRL